LKEAGAAFDRMMKEDQEQMITFDQMEDRALEVGGKLERWLMERCLEEAARQRFAATSVCCPHCHKSLPFKGSAKKRSLRGRTGTVSFERKECYCPSCRKAFFPSGCNTETGR
jgi:uncharacterized protein with PIN domain